MKALAHCECTHQRQCLPHVCRRVARNVPSLRPRLSPLELLPCVENMTSQHTQSTAIMRAYTSLRNIQAPAKAKIHVSAHEHTCTRGHALPHSQSAPSVPPALTILASCVYTCIHDDCRSQSYSQSGGSVDSSTVGCAS